MTDLAPLDTLPPARATPAETEAARRMVVKLAQDANESAVVMAMLGLEA